MATDRLARKRRLLAVVGVSAVVALLCAVINSGVVGGFPPTLKLHNLQEAAATSELNVDLPTSMPSVARGRGVFPDDPVTFTKRAELMGSMIISPPVLNRMAVRCGLPAGQISGLRRTTANVPDELTQPDGQQRASDIQASNATYRVEMQSRQSQPIIDIYTEAPTVAAAECLANAAPVALTAYLQTLAHAQGSTTPLPQVLPLGPARGGVANGGATLIVAMLTFVTMFGTMIGALLALGWLVRRRRAPHSGEPDEEPLFVPESFSNPLPELVAGDPSEGRDSWPHTRRPVPWMIALFLAVIWLTPFDNIQLRASLPVELRLDRLVLPFVVIVWLIAVAAGGRKAPRLKMTWIHVALAGLLATAFLSVVTDAQYLNHTLELQLSLKKLPLIVSYVLLFVVVASGVRRSEVRPFLTYTLVLAVIVGLGMILEYRTKQNLFWIWSGKIFSGPFELNGALNGDVLDATGRGLVRGSAVVPLEAVAMLTMALPIALVRVMQADRWRQRLIYGLATCILVAATFATYRKSALIAPLGVILTLAYFRRRELLRLAPLFLVLLVVVTSISPGAIGSTVRQFTRSDATAVPTVSDRASDYDAVRPDILTHLALGRGWGSYDHGVYRTLDSEILTRTIEGGVLGLVAFLLVPVAVVAVARRPIASGDPTDAPVALIGASVAVGFLVLSLLFDELSFPHAAYIFLYMAGLEAVVLRRRRGPDADLDPVAPRLRLDDRDLAPTSLAQEPLLPRR